MSPGLLQTLFDGGRIRANAEVFRARQRIAVADYERAVQTASREVADALATRRFVVDQLVARNDERAAQAERLRLADLRFREGEADGLEMLNARRELFAVEQALIALRRAQAANAGTLYTALGGDARLRAEAGGTVIAVTSRPFKETPMDNGSIIWILALATFAMVLGYAFWQRGRVEKAKKDHEHTAMTAGHPEQRRTDGAPGVKPQ